MNNKKSFIVYFCIFATCFLHSYVYAHDTTHIHPLITDEIADLIEKNDKTVKSYEDIYKPDPTKDEVQGMDQRLYWGTDFDAGKPSGDLTQDWVLENQFSAFHEPLNVMNGVVQEDIPDSKVANHFYQATSGSGLLTTVSSVNGGPASTRSMGYFKRAIDYFSMYDETAKKFAFFTFGQALHLVEDMLTPAHIHNDTENVLFAPILRYGQLINTHVVASTLRFLNCPCLALKQTGSFSGVVV